MRHLLIALSVGASAVAFTAHATTPAASEVLAANRAATVGQATSDKVAVKVDFAFVGQGLTGVASSLTDVRGGRFADSFHVGPASGGNGFDGTHAWQKEMSGSVTLQDGADPHALAINEAYRRGNLWWRADRGGAAIVADGENTDGGAAYEVLTVTPKDGKVFNAWFDQKTHLLGRIVEAQGPQTITTTLSDYRAVDGVMLPGKQVIDDGSGAKYVQTLTLTSASFLPAQPDSAYSAPKLVLADFAVDGGAAETTLPFKLINNHIYAEALINGKGPYLFIFDTGGQNLVTPALAKTLGLTLGGTIDAHGAGEGVMEAGLTKVGQLKLGHASVTDQVFFVLPLDSMSDVEGVPETGMVGYQTFRRFVTRIDYGARTLTLIDPKHFDPKDAGTPVKFTFADSNPEVQGTFEGIPAKFHIDTGSRVEVTLNKPFVANNGLMAKHAKGVDAVDGWGVGGPSRAYVTRGSGLTLGGVATSNVVASFSTQDKGAFAADDYQGNIGGGVLKRFVVTFDYEHQVMYLKPATGPVEDIGQFDRVGMWVNAAGDHFKIVDITSGGPAEAAGLKPGDEIVGIDGRPANALSLPDLRRLLRTGAPGSVISLQIVHSGAAKEVKVTLRDLI